MQWFSTRKHMSDSSENPDATSVYTSLFSLTSITLGSSLSTLDLCIRHSTACDKGTERRWPCSGSDSSYCETSLIDHPYHSTQLKERSHQPKPMTNLAARHADGGSLWFLQQHGYVPKVLCTDAMAVHSDSVVVER